MCCRFVDSSPLYITIVLGVASSVDQHAAFVSISQALLLTSTLARQHVGYSVSVKYPRPVSGAHNAHSIPYTACFRLPVRPMFFLFFCTHRVCSRRPPVVQEKQKHHRSLRRDVFKEACVHSGNDGSVVFQNMRLRVLAVDAKPCDFVNLGVQDSR